MYMGCVAGHDTSCNSSFNVCECKHGSYESQITRQSESRNGKPICLRFKRVVPVGFRSFSRKYERLRAPETARRINLPGGKYRGITSPEEEYAPRFAPGVSAYLANASSARTLVRASRISILNGPLFGQLELRMLRATRFVNSAESNYTNLSRADASA